MCLSLHSSVVMVSREFSWIILFGGSCLDAIVFLLVVGGSCVHVVVGLAQIARVYQSVPLLQVIGVRCGANFTFYRVVVHQYGHGDLVLRLLRVGIRVPLTEIVSFDHFAGVVCA